MKKTVLALLAMLCIMPLCAQITHSREGQEDKKASEVLTKAGLRFKDNVSFAVTATMLDSQRKQAVKQEARVLYHRGKYRVSMADQLVICDGTTVWQWNRKAKEVAVNNISTDDIDLFNPARLLTNYGKSFRSKYIRTENDGTAIVDLQPRSARSFHKIRLFVEEKSGLLRRMEVHKFDSSREVYDFSNFKKVATPDTEFTFDPAKHAGVEVIDMR